MPLAVLHSNSLIDTQTKTLLSFKHCLLDLTCKVGMATRDPGIKQTYKCLALWITKDALHIDNVLL